MSDNLESRVRELESEVITLKTKQFFQDRLLKEYEIRLIDLQTALSKNGIVIEHKELEEIEKLF